MYIVINTNKVIKYDTLSLQSSLYIKNRIGAKEKRSRILKRPP